MKKRMSQALRKLTPVVSKSNCIVIFINQLREKVGIMFGNPETTSGGRALKFYSSIRMEVRRIESIKENGEIVGNRIRIKIVKNKVAPPFTEAETAIYFNRGLDLYGELVDLAVSSGLIIKAGAWYTEAETDKETPLRWQGSASLRNYLIENPEYAENLKTLIKKKI